MRRRGHEKARGEFALERGHWPLHNPLTMSDKNSAVRMGFWLAKLRAIPSMLWRWEAQFKGVQLGGQVEFLGRPVISLADGGRMILGDGVVLRSAVRSTPLGCSQPCVLRVLSPGAQLIIGPRVGMSAAVVCAGLSIEIGEGTIVGAGAMVLDNDFHAPVGAWDWADEHRANARPIRIGRGVFIGARAIVLKGVTIGDRAVIGAGAVVVDNVPAGSVVAGNPARVVRGPERSETGK